MNIEMVNGPLPALIAGLLTSFHCIGMCGPLACALCPKKSDRPNTSPFSTLIAYHGARAISYTLLGAVAGWLGSTITGVFTSQLFNILPWAFVAWFIFLAIGWEKYFKLPSVTGGSRLAFLLSKVQGTPLGIALGLITPAIPCGPLYLMFGVAALSGSAQNGAVIMSLFSVGTIPLLFATQFQLVKMSHWLNPHYLRWGQAALAIISAALIFWRVSYGEPPSTTQKPKCPMCHTKDSP